jgi:hypothetical protein
MVSGAGFARKLEDFNAEKKKDPASAIHWRRDESTVQ